MSFQTTANQPVTNAKVTLTFSGLMVLKPGPNNTCEIGVHRFSRDHLFQVMLIVNRSDRPPTLIPIFTGPLMSPLSIRLHPDPNPGGGDFVAFAPTPSPFDRSVPNDERDFRWSINLRDHHPNAQTNGGAQPGITLKTGVLYTPNLSDPNLGLHLRQGGAPVIPLNRIAEDLAVSIMPSAQSVVVFEWEDLGDPNSLVLPRNGDPADTTYTVAFNNNPPSLTAEAHDELSLYYKILRDGGNAIVPDMRFTLGTAPGTRSDEVPCMPVTLNP